MKSYAGNWQINHNSQNRMSEKMVSERMANEITELLRRDRKWDMDAREDLEQVFFCFFVFFNLHKSLSTSSCQIKTFNQSQKILEQSTNFQRKRNTVSPIKTLGFQDRLSGIAPSFDFVNFVKKTKKQKKNLFEIFPRTDSILFSLKVGRLFQDFLGLIKSFNLTRTCWKWFVQVYFLDNKWGLLIFNS
jgi:hypothetical protein